MCRACRGSKQIQKASFGLEVHVVDNDDVEVRGMPPNHRLAIPPRRVYNSSTATSRWYFLRVPPVNELPN